MVKPIVSARAGTLGFTTGSSLRGSEALRDHLAAVVRNGEQLPALEVASSTTSDEAREMENLGGGVFSDDGPIGFAGEFPQVRRFIAADLDLDDTLNDMLGMLSNGRIEVWDDNNSGLQHADFSDVPEAKVDFNAADWDSDGDFDFVAVPPELVGLRHWENTGEMFDNPVTWEDSDIAGPAMPWFTLLGGELNGDMSGDIAAIDPDEGDMRTAFGLWNGNGDGTFFGASLSVLPGVYEHGEAAHFFNSLRTQDTSRGRCRSGWPRPCGRRPGWP